MLLELGTALALIASGHAAFRSGAFLLSAALLVVLWISTFALQVPLHAQLAQGFDADAHTQLVRSNWIRTIAWTARGILLLGVAQLLFPRSVP